MRALASLTLALVISIGLTGCADQGPTADNTDLSLLVRLASPDSATGPDPVAAPPTGPGFFQGVVAGEGTPSTERSIDVLGPDLPDVRVTVYPLLESSAPAMPQMGAAIDTRVTNAYGEFETAEIPGAKYVVTFVPPNGSIYKGAYWIATAHPHDVPVFWRVVLPKK